MLLIPFTVAPVDSRGADDGEESFGFRRALLLLWDESWDEAGRSPSSSDSPSRVLLCGVTLGAMIATIALHSAREVDIEKVDMRCGTRPGRVIAKTRPFMEDITAAFGGFIHY